MNVLVNSKSIPFWSVTLVALGIHGLILAVPIALNEPVQEKPKSAPVKLQKLPLSKVSIVPKPKSSPLPSGAIVPPAPITNSSVSTVPQPIVSTAAQQPVFQTVAPPQTVASSQTVAPPQTATPSQTATPPVTPEKVSDIFQIVGAVACSNVKDCYSTADTTGVSVADKVIANFNKKGYDTKERADLRLDQPMKIYEIRKDSNKTVEYLHIIWGRGTGTRTLILTKIVDDWSELAAIALL